MLRAQDIGKRIVRQSIFVVLIRALGVSATLCLELYISRTQGAQVYGQFSFILSYGLVLSMLVPLGWNNASTRFVSEYLEKRDYGLLTGFLITSNFFVLFSALIAAYCVLLLPSTIVDRPIGWAIALLIAPLSLLELANLTFRGLDKGGLGTSLRLLFVPVTALALLTLSDEINGTIAATYYSIATLVVFLFAGVMLVSARPLRGELRSPEFRLVGWFSAALPMTMSGVSAVFLQYVDVIMIGMMANMTDVGFYQASARISLLSLFVLRSVHAVILPKIVADYHAGSQKSFVTIFRIGVVISTLGTLPIIGIIFLLPDILLDVFGSGFSGSTPLLIILTLGRLTSVITGGLAAVLMMVGKERSLAIVISVILLLNIFGNLALIPLLGALGAALTTTACLAIQNTALLFIFVRLLRSDRS